MLLGKVEDCSDDTTNDPDAPRCSRKSWLAIALFLFYILVTAIMLINLLIAIFRLRCSDIVTSQTIFICPIAIPQHGTDYQISFFVCVCMYVCMYLWARLRSHYSTDLHETW